MTTPFRVLTVVGARPQFVKAAAVSAAILRANRIAGLALVEETLVHTGQHYDAAMSDVFFAELGIPRPAANLGVHGGSHAEATAEMMQRLEGELTARRPDAVLVYGDTNSTLAGALAAAKLPLPIVHVEAGLRSYDRSMPEEVNRVLVDHVSAQLLCPTETARRNLAREGLERGVHVVGDVMKDVFLAALPRAVPCGIDEPFALATIHRAANTDCPARLDALLELLAACPLPVVLPVHPRLAGALDARGRALPPNLRPTAPRSYLEMLGLLSACAFVATDSGGLQKEAFFAGKRCVVLRDRTEWVELVEIGAARLGEGDGADAGELFAWAGQPLHADAQPYGDGHAADRVVECILALAGGGGG